MFTNDSELHHKNYYSHNFDHNGPLAFHELGINCKISELQAVMGLAVLLYLEEIFRVKRRVCNYYAQHFDFTTLAKFKIREGTDWNYSYYPVIFKSKEVPLKVNAALNAENFIPRRYFYPSLNTILYTNGKNYAFKPRYICTLFMFTIVCRPNRKRFAKIVKIINNNLC